MSNCIVLAIMCAMVQLYGLGFFFFKNKKSLINYAWKSNITLYFTYFGCHP
jgi:hypothetical protein